jgi:drug/metabolite transporter (DMT)-like permease
VLIVALRVEGFDIWRALGVLAGFIGVGFIVLPQGSLPEPGQVGWVLLGLGAACFYALQNVYIARHSPPDADVLTQTTGMLIVGGLAALPLAAAMDGFLWPTWPMSIAVQSAAIMLLINAVMMFMFVWVARTIGPVFASMTANVITLAGVLWGWVIFQESPSSWIWAAMVAMALGVALVTLRRASPAKL